MIALFIALLLQTSAARAKPAPAPALVRGKIVADDTNTPISYAAVELHRASDQTLRRAYTDSAGAFEISGVEPGNYMLRAGKTGFVTAGYKDPDDDTAPLRLAPADTKEVSLRLARGAVIAGTITDTMGEPVNGATVSLLRKIYSGGHAQYATPSSGFTDDRGDYRLFNLPAGRYYVKVTKNLTPGGAGLPVSPTFFPAARRQQDAAPITLRAGEERDGANVTLQDAALYDVAGRVIDARTGEPMVNAYLNLMPAFGGGMMYNDRAQPDGAFRLRNIPAGSYRINVSAGYADRARAPVNSTRTVEISGNTSDLVIRIGAGSTITGKVQSVAGAALPNMMVLMTQRLSDGSALRTTSGAVDPKGAFEMAGVEPGTYEIAVGVLGENVGDVVMTSAVLAYASSPSSARDVTDSAVEIGDTDALVLTVTVDASPATVSGKVFDGEAEGKAKALPRVPIALVSADAKKRAIYRYFHAATTKRDGSFELSGIAPGKYLLIPWPAEDSGQVLDPDVFPMVESLATPVTVEHGGKVTQDLRLTRALRTLADTFAQ